MVEWLWFCVFDSKERTRRRSDSCGTCTPANGKRWVVRTRTGVWGNSRGLRGNVVYLDRLVESELLLLRIETRDERKGTQHACQWQNQGLVAGGLLRCDGNVKVPARWRTSSPRGSSRCGCCACCARTSETARQCGHGSGRLARGLWFKTRPRTGEGSSSDRTAQGWVQGQHGQGSQKGKMGFEWASRSLKS